MVDVGTTRARSPLSPRRSKARLAALHSSHSCSRKMRSRHAVRCASALHRHAATTKCAASPTFCSGRSSSSPWAASNCNCSGVRIATSISHLRRRQCLATRAPNASSPGPPHNPLLAAARATMVIAARASRSAPSRRGPAARVRRCQTAQTSATPRCALNC